jgi:hypothetical protein
MLLPLDDANRWVDMFDHHWRKVVFGWAYRRWEGSYVDFDQCWNDVLCALCSQRFKWPCGVPRGVVFTEMSHALCLDYRKRKSRHITSSVSADDLSVLDVIGDDVGEECCSLDELKRLVLYSPRFRQWVDAAYGCPDGVLLHEWCASRLGMTPAGSESLLNRLRIMLVSLGYRLHLRRFGSTIPLPVRCRLLASPR